MKEKIPRKLRRQIERRLAKRNRKELVKQHNATFEAEKFFESDEGIEYFDELVKLYIQNNT